MSNRKKWNDINRAPEGSVPDKFKRDGSYRPGGGYKCRKCEYVTKKKGFGGRQALRAHLKVHKLERRSWQRPLVRQMLVTLVAGLVIVGANLRFIQASSMWAVTVPTLALWILAGVVGVVLVPAALASVFPQLDPEPAGVACS